MVTLFSTPNYVGQFTITSIHGRLVQGYTNGQVHASQNVDHVGDEERWLMYAFGERVMLKNLRTQRWLCGEDSGRAIADREVVADWEMWTPIRVGHKIAFRSHHGKYLCAQPPGQDTRWGGEVCADRNAIGAWETFDVIPSEGVPFPGQPWWQKALEIAVEYGPIVIAAA